jgi:GT2 family glycosyltransferase
MVFIRNERIPSADPIIVTLNLSIVIPVYNKYNFTKACLEDLKKLPSNHEIIIVDNGSSDETQVELKKLVNSGFNFVYVRNEENYGFAKACNIGYSMSRSSNVMFLNNDIRVKDQHDSWTKEFIECADEGLVGPTMGQLDNNLNFVQEANRVLPGNSYMGGWCLAASKRIWEQLEVLREPVHIHDTYIFQIFSEEFGIAYFEDTDLSFRAKQKGIQFKIVEIPVTHFGKVTSKQLNTSKLYSEARQIFIKKWTNKVPR